MPRTHIPDQLRRLVIERALGCCEFCLIHQDHTPEPHHIDHLLAIKHNGKTEAPNLALACARCNRFKGSDLAAIDPADGNPVLLFNPRTQVWQEHFAFEGVLIVGLTPSGRATVELLRMNDQSVLAHRRQLILKKQYPPSYVQ
ncbi:MAG: HNH endonuclease [Blastocatellales bacterium]